PLSPEILQLSVHCLDRELLRVELAADPFLHVPVVPVPRNDYRFQEIGVAPDTAAVLGRTSPGSFGAPGILDLGLRLNNSLKLDAVLPAISEVVLIDKPGVLAGLDDLAQQDAILIFHLHAEVQVVEIRFTVVFVVDDKLMHVAVLPAHDGLDDLMKIAEGTVRNLNTPPDRRLGVHERDLELIYLASRFGGCGVRFWFRLLDPDPLGFDAQLGPDLIKQSVADVPGVPRLGPPLIDLAIVEVRVPAQGFAEELGLRFCLRRFLLCHERSPADRGRTR